jgi:hypothetical protein
MATDLTFGEFRDSHLKRVNAIKAQILEIERKISDITDREDLKPYISSDAKSGYNFVDRAKGETCVMVQVPKKYNSLTGGINEAHTVEQCTYPLGLGYKFLQYSTATVQWIKDIAVLKDDLSIENTTYEAELVASFGFDPVAANRQNQEDLKNANSAFGWKAKAPYIIGGIGILLVAGIIFYVIYKKKKI